MDERNVVYVTQEGLEKLKQRLDDLIHIDIPKNIEDLAEARAQGDLSENADYDAARDQQARLEAKKVELEAQIQNAVIIEENKKKKVVSVGDTVTIRDLSDDSVEEYQIVGTVEADPFNGKLSNDTPLAKAIIDRKVGAKVMVSVINGYSYEVEILSIK